MSEDLIKLKDDGNQYFKSGDYTRALNCYDRALKLLSSPSGTQSNGCTGNDGNLKENEIKKLRSNLYNNRSAVNLKRKEYADAENDATKALELIPTDSKALFRRCQARENLHNYSDAFKDAKLALHYDQHNKLLEQTLQRLSAIIQEKQKEAVTTESRTKNMFELCFDKTKDMEKRIQAMNNLLVLARDNSGANCIFELKGVEKIMEVIKNEKSNPDLTLSAYRVLDQMASDEQKALRLLKLVTVESVVGLLNRNESQIIDAASLLVQHCLNALAAMNPKELKKPDETTVEKNKVVLIDLIFELKRILTNPSFGALPRIAAIDLLLKNLIHMDHGLPRGWSWEFISNDGLERLLEVSCNIPEQCRLPVTVNTREHLAICMARLYDDTVFDQYRANYKDVVDKFIKNKFDQNPLTRERKIEIVSCLTTLLIGPFDIGISVVTNDTITKMMLEMAGSDDELLQMVAAEAIVQTASKRERCSAIIASGMPILKQLYDSKNDNIKARALVGLCKCAASSGTDVSMKPLAEGSTLKLAQACKKLLTGGNKDADVRRWASEGLSYLTLDADVKELLVEDASLIRALVELAKQCGSLCVFGVASVFVNLTNTYEKPNPEPELVKLAQFAKHHVPEEHPKDAPEFVEKRIALLVKEGAVAACVALSNTESLQCREFLARALFAFSKDVSHRGIVVQEGGAKLLVKLAVAGTEHCKTFAAQALAKIGVTMNPEIAFPGQRCYEVIRPLVSLLHVEKTGLQNYEALLALTNLSSLSDSVRKRIFKEKAMPAIEEYWFMQEHKDLRAAAAELLLNLLHCEEIFQYVSVPGTDRLKLWLLYSAEEDDDRLCKASTAGLVILTSSKENCKRIVNEIERWVEIFKDVITRDNVIVQHRALTALANMMESDYDVAANIVRTELMDYLIVISKLEDKTRQDAKTEAARAVSAAEKWELIKPSDRELYERQHKTSTLPKDA